ncbi:hypothetical protein LIER_16268 [Lithospermum erythrorhizon]|uniref:Uncharacterized protein n=1 Tax=Lithospermum erythrorhizon TaxID=34254 RepID=A0AAV3Q605_LITER
MGILEDAEVMPTVEIVGPYFPMLVTLQNYTINFSPSLINVYYGRANGGKIGAKLKFSEIANVLTGGTVDTWLDKGQIPSSKWSVNIIEAQQPDILTTADEEANFLGFITINPKLLQITHVADISLRVIEIGSGSGAGNEESTRFLRDEIKHLDGMIQSRLA